jgi:hypothetical protein
MFIQHTEITYQNQPDHILQFQRGNSCQKEEGSTASTEISVDENQAWVARFGTFGCWLLHDNTPAHTVKM